MAAESSVERDFCLKEELRLFRLLRPSNPSSFPSSSWELPSSRRPSSTFGPSAALDLVRGRLLGWPDASAFFCFTILATLCAVESAASSPDASRDDGCCRSAGTSCLFAFSTVLALFRLLEPEDEGDDISGVRSGQLACSSLLEGFVTAQGSFVQWCLP